MFTVQFGPACHPIFEYLGFEAFQDENDESYWRAPACPPQTGKTQLVSTRAFLEDVRSEVQCMLSTLPQVQGMPALLPVLSAHQMLEKELGLPSRQLPGGPAPNADDLADLRALGAAGILSNDELKYAYRRQVQTDPWNRQKYLSALGRLATSRRAESLQMFCINAGSLSDKMERTYRFLGFYDEPDAAIDEQITLAFWRRREETPRQEKQLRTALLDIARHRQSEALHSQVFENWTSSVACDVLEVKEDWLLETISQQALASRNETDPELLVAALKNILAFRFDDPEAFHVKNAIAELSGTSHEQAVANDAGEGRDSSAADMGLPVGLGNLRNTCYLNSILQYFFSVVAIQDLVQSSSLPEMTPTDESLQELLKRGSATDLEPGRAFVGSEFARELGTLFKSMHSADGSYVSPRQRLANAALLRPERIRNDAPPLPPRAGESGEAKNESSETASHTSSKTAVEKPEEDPSTYVVIAHDVAEDGSTAMDVDGPDAPAAGAPKGASGKKSTLTIEELVAEHDKPTDASGKKSKLTVEELAAELDKPNVGSDQMDVDEVMGNAIDHLRAAFKVSQIGGSGDGRDPIEQAFFSTFVDVRKKVGETTWTRTARSDRWATAFPGKQGQRDLYDALSVSFDLERLPGDLLSFTTIEKPAPNFHICIQRSDGLSKNSNPIKIHDTLYLDRFMYPVSATSSEFQAVQRSWNIKARLAEIDTVGGASDPAASNTPFVQKAAADKEAPKPTDEMVDDYIMLGRRHGSLSQENGSSGMNRSASGWSVVDTAIERILGNHPTVKFNRPQASIADTSIEPPLATDSIETESSIPQETLKEFWVNFGRLEEHEAQRLASENSMLFQDMNQVAYRLHAVVCHAGKTASSGHYWVWIHDFEEDVWRKYNDTRVEVHPADFVFQELNTKGEPYYLAYVRATEVNELVRVPKRAPQEVQMNDAPDPTAAETEDVSTNPLSYGA